MGHGRCCRAKTDSEALPVESTGGTQLQSNCNNGSGRTAGADPSAAPHRRDAGLYAGGHSRDSQGCSAGCAGSAGRGDHSGQYLSPLSAARPRGHPTHGRAAPVHQLAAGDADRLRRLSGLQPERAAQGDGRGRALPVASGREFALFYSRTLHRRADCAGRGHLHGLRRVHRIPGRAEAEREESLRLTMAWARRSLDHFRAHCHEVPWHEELGGRTAEPIRHRAGRNVHGPAPGERRAAGGDGFRRLRNRRLERGRAARVDDGDDCRGAAAAARR